MAFPKLANRTMSEREALPQLGDRIVSDDLVDAMMASRFCPSTMSRSTAQGLLRDTLSASMMCLSLPEAIELGSDVVEQYVPGLGGEGHRAKRGLFAVFVFDVFLKAVVDELSKKMTVRIPPNKPRPARALP